MKRVSFEVAKALKEAGYPQNPYNTTLWFNLNGEQISDDAVIDDDVDINTVCAAPTYFEAWVWLFNKKDIVIEPKCQINDNGKCYWENGYIDCTYYDQEEALEAAIEYIVASKRLK